MQAYHQSFNPQAYSTNAAAAAAAAAYYQHHNTANYVLPTQYSSITDGFGYSANPTMAAAAALANTSQVYNPQQVWIDSLDFLFVFFLFILVY